MPRSSRTSCGDLSETRMLARRHARRGCSLREPWGDHHEQSPMPRAHCELESGDGTPCDPTNSPLDSRTPRRAIPTRRHRRRRHRQRPISIRLLTELRRTEAASPLEITRFHTSFPSRQDHRESYSRLTAPAHVRPSRDASTNNRRATRASHRPAPKNWRT